MADVNCPTCGQPTPAELEECRFCGARLTPHPDSSGDNPARDADSNQSLPPGPFPDSTEDTSDQLSSLRKAASTDEQEIPDWLASLRGEKAGMSTLDSALTPDPTLKATGSLSAGSGDSDWLARLDNTAQPRTPEQPATSQGDGVPDWLNGLPVSSEENKPFANQAEDLPDWLNQLKEKAIDLGPVQGGNEETATSSGTRDWLDTLGPASGTPEAARGENLPDWLSNLGAKTGPESSSEPPSSTQAREKIPDWLSQFQADINSAQEQEDKQGQFEQAPPLQEIKKGTEPLPDWLAGIQPTTTHPDGTPALIANDEGKTYPGKGEAAFSMETPDWLSKLKPEKSEEKTPAEQVETSAPGNLEIFELPSWVQAMRPVESVVAETGSILQEQDDVQVTEQSGPLAGLQGVLPVDPGLGALRKPPPYSTILQVSDSQQRYSAALERLISNETQPQAARSGGLVSNRLWRWLIAVLLIMAVGLPLITGIQVTPASKLRPPELMDALALINNLPATSPNSPVLVVFEYDPALSGELEAAAAPLMERILLQGSSLVLISTSPTGPALAERFMQAISTSPLVAGQQYVNLGYLAGGPAGVLYFSIFPTEAARFTLDGQPAWELPLLQGTRKLSDFAAIIVLTDNADSGRIWIEQTGYALGNTPMLMVISAQVEPMILPYYDSRQIKGLVTGLAGGNALDQAIVRPVAQTSLPQRYWNSFSAGMLVAEILIIIGALLSIAVGWRTRRKQSGEVPVPFRGEGV